MLESVAPLATVEAEERPQHRFGLAGRVHASSGWNRRHVFDRGMGSGQSLWRTLGRGREAKATTELHRGYATAWKAERS